MNNEYATCAEEWEEGRLGADINFAKKAPAELEKQVEDALGLKLISIRLPSNLIDAFKLLAEIEGVGYQPLMRDVLARYADSELKQIARTVSPEDVERARNMIPEEVDPKKLAA
jgi:predicted DNA binding CopG/RHH family protein